MKQKEKKVALFAIMLISVTCSAQNIAIDSLSHHFASPLSIVTLFGSGFSSIDSLNKVFWGEVKAEVVSSSPAAIEFKVPLGPTYGRVSVSFNNRTAYSMQFLSTIFEGGTITKATFIDQEMSLNNVPRTAQYIAHGDFDADGKLDMIVSSAASNSLTIFKNNTPLNYNGTNLSENSFENGINLRTDTTLYALFVSDLNADGKPDILATTKGGNKIFLFENQSTNGVLDSTSFKQPVPLSLNTNIVAEIVTSDLNRDGLPDIIVSSTSSNSSSRFFVLKNNLTTSTIVASGFVDTLEIVTGGPSNDGPFGLNATDLTGDGFDDIVITQGYNKRVLLYQNQSAMSSSGDIKISPFTYISESKSPYFIASGDLNSDGKNDLAISLGDSMILVLINVESNHTLDSASFKKIYIKPSSINDQFSQNLQLKIADMNGDKKPDIISTNWLNSININWNTITETQNVVASDFAQMKQIVMSAPFGLTIADFNRDGRPDMASTYNVKNLSSPNGKIYLVTNNSGFATGLSEMNDPKGNPLLIYPNPTASWIKVIADEMSYPLDIRMFSLEGKLVLHDILNDKNGKVIMGEIQNNGCYFVIVKDMNGKTSRQKIVFAR
jgi:hypothetical protein